MRVRGVASAIAILLGAVLLPLGVLGFWAHRTVIDTDTYVATVAPLADDPVVQQAVAAQVSATLLDAVRDNPVLGQLLAPGSAAGDALGSRIEELVLRVVGSDGFAGVWTDLNRRVQVSAIAALAGHPEGPVSLQGDRLVVDTGVVLLAVQGRLAQELPVIGQVDLTGAGRPLVVADSPAVGRAHSYYAWLDALGPWLAPAAAALLLTGVLLARRRVRATLVVGVVVLIGAGVVALALVIGGRLAERALDGTAFQPAARSVVSVLTTDAARYAWWLAALGVLLLVAGALLATARRHRA